MITHHGYAGDVGAGPADVLHEEGELCGVEPAVVGCLWRVGVAAAVQVWEPRWVCGWLDGRGTHRRAVHGSHS